MKGDITKKSFRKKKQYNKVNMKKGPVQLDSDWNEQMSPRYKMEDLVLPKKEKEILREIVSHVKNNYKVYKELGSEEKWNIGLGISALFVGPSGTGKTMATEVLANELHLPLFRIDLSALVSKYIGETEKRLRIVFDAAEDGGAILFFDEVDALFGRRSEIKDSHDRYSNVEIGYLLQLIEKHQGLTILATNIKIQFDPAFIRRLSFIVNFPFPDEKSRLEIWKRVFPSNVPIEKVDFNLLSPLSLTGGEIRNIALSAAFMAADENVAITMKHLKRAAMLNKPK